jgi:hypothetical protein
MNNVTKGANYSAYTLKEGDVLRNVNGKKTAIYIEWTNRGRRIKVIDSTSKSDVLEYWDTLSSKQLQQRFPVLVKNARHEIKVSDLTDEEFARVSALLKEANVNFTADRIK